MGIRARLGATAGERPGFVVDQGLLGLAAVKQGVLRTVLEDWVPMGPGFHIYYSSRRQVPAALRLFIELVRELRPMA